MAVALEIRERQKKHLNSLLTVKKANQARGGVDLPELQKEINDAVVVMDQEDVAYVEKIVGIKAL